MKRGIIIAVLVLGALAFTIPASAAVDGADATAYHIEGYVAEGGGSGKIPMSDVTVNIYDALGNTYSGKSDESGFFSVDVPRNVNLQISFSAFGYTMISCPNTTPQQGTDRLILNLSTATYNSGTRTYTITSDLDGMQCAIMTASDGVVRGTVSYESGNVAGATVRLDPRNGEPVYTAVTDDKGYYEIVCPIGTYYTTVSCKGFTQSGVSVVNITNSPSLQNIMLYKSDVKEYGGLDLAHILMLIGVSVGIVLAISAWMLSRRMNGPEGPGIIDDSEEDEDIRYP